MNGAMIEAAGTFGTHETSETLVVNRINGRNGFLDKEGELTLGSLTMPDADTSM
jgi:hypothetical protein